LVEKEMETLAGFASNLESKLTWFITKVIVDDNYHLPQFERK